MKKLMLVILLLGLTLQSVFAEEPENPWLNMKPVAPAAGALITTFIKLRGEPDRRELRDGEDVLWYDGAEPYYAIFKDGKLTSYYIDRETIARRMDEYRRQQEALARAQYEEQEQQQEQERTRRQNISNYFRNAAQSQQQQPYKIPVNRPVNTNCTPGVGGSIQCTSY